MIKKLICKIFGCKTQEFVVTGQTTRSREILTGFGVPFYVDELVDVGHYYQYNNCPRCGRKIK